MKRARGRKRAGNYVFKCGRVVWSTKCREREREREREGEGRGEGEEEGNEKKDMGINFEGSFGQRGNSLTWSAALAWSIDFY